MGLPTTFVRFGGCNLRCPGWPCDTLYAVLPEFRKDWTDVTPEDVFEEVKAKGLHHVCITGGEPLIQAPSQMIDLTERLWAEGYTIDLFTNGSKVLPEWTRPSHVTVVLDYKLPGSGEYGSFNEENWTRLAPNDAVKFVCKDRQDFMQAEAILLEHQRDLKFLHVYFGVAYGLLTEAALGGWLLGSLLAVNHRGVRLNIQTHKVIGVR